MKAEAVELPFKVVGGDLSMGLLLLCDHATSHIPAAYDNLGLSAAELQRHIAYDIGAEQVTLALAERLQCPAVFANFGRLFIDANRGEDDPTLIMRLSDGAVVPGNVSVDAKERQYRIEVFHARYHQAITTTIDRFLSAGIVPILVSIHSFTPQWRGRPRPWEVGILWDRDGRAAKPMIDLLRKEGDLTVGDNEPYSGALINDTLYRHGTRRGFAHLLIEIRQDLISDRMGVDNWSGRLTRLLKLVNADREAHEVRYFGSMTGPVEPLL